MISGVQDAPAGQIYRLTPAKAHDWARCGGYYAASHLGGAPRPKGYACLLGTAVHELIAVHEQHGGSPAGDLGDFLARHWRPGRFAAQDDAGARAEALPLLAAYRELRATERVAVLGVEEFLRTGPRSLGDGRSVILSGKLDRLARRQDGTIEVLDYKTGGALPTRDELRRDPATAIYHLLAAERHGAAPIAVVQLSLRTGARVEVSLDADDLAAGKGQVREMVRQLASGAFALAPGDACGYCPANDRCPALRNGAEAADRPL